MVQPVGVDPPLRLGLVRLREAGAAGIAGISLLQSQGQK
jgi:hypothetical protein